MLVYFDTSALQRPWDDFAIERNRLEGEAMELLFEAFDSGRFEIVTSSALEIELADDPNPDRKRFLSRLLDRASVKVEFDLFTDALTPRFESVGFGELDAMHLAFAMRVHANVLTLSDDRFLKRAKSLIEPPPRFLTPLELCEELQP